MPPFPAGYDLSNTQMAILALWEAANAGVEIPDTVWQKAQELYYKLQQQDGSWNYGEHGPNIPGYGSMTAAGLASVYIIDDNLNPGRGCPCRNGVSSRERGEAEKRIDSALDWLGKKFVPDKNPLMNDSMYYYWLYSVERVGLAAGYKYFGTHNWFKEGAELVIKNQGGDGHWDDNTGPIPATCLVLQRHLTLLRGGSPHPPRKKQYSWPVARRVRRPAAPSGVVVLGSATLISASQLGRILISVGQAHVEFEREAVHGGIGSHPLPRGNRK